MNAFDKQPDKFEDELDELRDKLLVADANYENATTISELHAADAECKRLRAEIQARLQKLRIFKMDVKDGSAPTKSIEPRKKAKATGE
jgi:hypothetical protein